MCCGVRFPAECLEFDPPRPLWCFQIGMSISHDDTGGISLATAQVGFADFASLRRGWERADRGQLPNDDANYLNGCSMVQARVQTQVQLVVKGVAA